MRREDKEAAKKGNFFTNSNNNGIPSLNQQNKYNANETSDWVHRIERIREKPI